jgi:hypothetical protein
MIYNPNKFSKEAIDLLQRPVIDNFISVEDAAKALNITSRMVRYLITSGWLYGSVKVGKVWLVCKVGLEDYIENIKGKPDAECHR